MRKYRRKISYSLQAIGLVPLLVFGIVIIVFSSRTFTEAMHKEVETELYNVAQNVITMLDIAYPGDYELVGETAYRLHKGGVDITNEYGVIDQVKETTGMEVTLFYQDARVLTTIRDAAGSRIIGTAAPYVVLHDVLDSGEPRFYSRILIYDTVFFGYYTPLIHSDGDVIGMLFVGKESDEINAAISTSVLPIIILGIIFLILTCIVTFQYTRTITNVLAKIQVFLAKVSTGDLNTELSSEVLLRNDELGEIGYSAMHMQRSLRSLVEQDMLTGLYNRRCGEAKLLKTIAKAKNLSTPYSVAIGDIDFFKKVNDTYGHECGDLVLKSIAGLLKKHMGGKGYAVRWGGEEFLLVYEKLDSRAAFEHLETLLEAIRKESILYHEEEISVTMTFGISLDTSHIPELIIKEADDKLYEGKMSGRNRIII